MFKSALACVATTVLATTLTVAPAEAATYAVTLKTPAAKVDLGKTFTLAGSVTGAGKGGKTLRIQRKIGSGAWSTYSTVKTRSTGTFSKTLTMPSVGAKNFRVVASAQGSVKQGISATKVVTGYTWLRLTDQGLEVATSNYGSSSGSDIAGGSTGVTATVAGKSYPGSIRVVVPPGGGENLGVYVLADLAARCDRVTFGYGLDDVSEPGADPQPVISLGGRSVNGDPDMDVYTPSSATATTALTTVDRPISSGIKVFQLGWSHRVGTKKAVVAFTTPRVHCASTSLPDSRFVELFPFVS